MTTVKKPRLCKDCMAEDPSGKQASRRAGTFPGPRCYAHHHVRKRAVRLANHSTRTATRYSMPAENYWKIYEFQGGRCAVCQRAGGNPNGDRGKRQLAVDHDHSCCPGKTSCGRCVRGLVCGPCNDVLAHFRDDPAAFRRAADYLDVWPTRSMSLVLGNV